MKRKKEDEKGMGPMFPRLHVNDTEKVGPKAPPRNKMALYEQLSIPSQRFNPNINTSSTQRSENKIPMFHPLHLPRSTPLADSSNATSSGFNNSLAATQKSLNEEDFTVPVFVQPENGQNNKNSDSVERDTVPLSRSAHNLSSRNQSTCSKEQKQNSATFSGLRQKDRCQTQIIQCPLEDHEDTDLRTYNVERLQSTNNALHHEVIDRSQLQSVHNATSNGKYQKDKTNYSLGIQNGDRCDDGSDTSMLDFVAAAYITPDDVVGVIGQKHFWKARRAIVNQQRVFAVQVFELHRLIKVQKLFAGSPNLAVEDSAFPGKSLKTSIPKQISLEFIVKPLANTENRKENHLKIPSQKTEVPAENTVKESSFPSSPHVSHHHLSNQTPFSSNTQPTPVTTDPSTSPWYLNQPTGYQWLVPVMSPTEGLIYKPYAGPAHDGSNPVMNNFSYPPFAIPNSHPSMTHHGYFPPYGMPPVGPAFSMVDQGNHSVGTNFNDQQQGSCNGSTQKNDSKLDTPDLVKTRMGKESGLQFSTASSPRGGRNSPLADDVATENVARVIRVVPRDAVSANETAFWIFQSIQKEREEQYESV